MVGNLETCWAEAMVAMKVNWQFESSLVLHLTYSLATSFYLNINKYTFS